MSPLAESILQDLRASPRQFSEVVDSYRDVSWPEFLKAWGEVRDLKSLTRDENGCYLLTES